MIDLHTHSTCSDGSEPPRRIVELAVEAGCRALSLTDHDSFDGIGAARARADELSLEFVAGCEVSCSSPFGALHLLCYFACDEQSALGRLLLRARADRSVRNERIAARLTELGIADSAKDAANESKGSVVGRPHFAAVLVRRGVASSIEDAFDRYLKRGAPAYVAREPLEAFEVIRAARASGAVVALAHPLSTVLDPADLDRLVGNLAGAGLVGLEAHYGGYGRREREALVGLARTNGLVPTGGSDFHGAYRPQARVGVGSGDLDVPDSVLAELAARVA